MLALSFGPFRVSCPAQLGFLKGLAYAEVSGMSEGFVGTQQPVITAFLAGISSRLNAGVHSAI